MEEIKGKLHVISHDIERLYDLGDAVERYLGLFASFEEWCKQADAQDKVDE